jgi:hypothetical protein
MYHFYILASSSNETYISLENHINKCNSSNALGNKYDVIPSTLQSQINILHTSQKFKECKEYYKTHHLNSDFKEVLFDGNINDLNAIFQNEHTTFWVLRVLANTLLSSLFPKVPSKITSHKYLVFQVLNNKEKFLIGICNTLFHAHRVIEDSCDTKIPDLDFELSVNEEKTINIGLLEYVVIRKS